MKQAPTFAFKSLNAAYKKAGGNKAQDKIEQSNQKVYTFILPVIDYFPLRKKVFKQKLQRKDEGKNNNLNLL